MDSPTIRGKETHYLFYFMESKQGGLFVCCCCVYFLLDVNFSDDKVYVICPKEICNDVIYEASKNLALSGFSTEKEGEGGKSN